MNLFQRGIKASVWVGLRFLYRVRVRQGQNIPKTGPAILIPNHVSFIDAVLIAAHVNRPVRYAMHWKIYEKCKWIVAPMGAFPIAGKDNPEVYAKAFEIMDATLADGGLLCIFPEGMITTTGEMNPFRNGILKLLRRNPVPVIPVGIRGLWGSYFSKKKKGVFKLPDHWGAKIEMVVGDVMEPSASLEELHHAVEELAK